MRSGVRGWRAAAGPCGAALTAVALTAVPGGASSEPPQAPDVGVEVSRSGGAELTTAVVPGRLLAVVAPSLPAGGRELFLLVEPEGRLDAPRLLFRLDLDGGALVEVARGLPAAGKALHAVDLDGDGEGDLLLGALGALYALGPVSAPGRSPPRRLLAHPGFDLRSLAPGRIRIPGGERWIAAAESGALRLYSLTREGAAREGRAREGLELRREDPLPVQATREPTGLRLVSPPVHALARPGAPLPLFAVGPEAVGPRRLRTVLLDPAAKGEGARSEAWSLLPAAEEVEQSWYHLVDGRPVLFVATQTAERIGIFEKRLLRVFPLSADRTRAGRRPGLEVETQSQRWFSMDLAVADVDGDGRRDMVLLQPEGLGGGELLLEAFPGIGGGRFIVRTRRTKIDPAPELWLYGRDLTGDGRPDLAAVEGGTLSLYPASSSRRRVVDKRPRWSVALPAVLAGDGGEDRESARGGDGALAAADLQGDGRPELLLLRTEVRGRGLLVVVRQP